MPITERQRDPEVRIKTVGASDLPKMLNLSKYGSSYDLYLEKAGITEPYQPGEAALTGTLLEPAILLEAENRLGRIRRNQRRVHPNKELRLSASCDAILVSSNEPVEAKTHGLFTGVFDAWGDEGTDEVPDHVLVQVHGQMMCISDDCRRAYVGAVIGGRGLVWYEVPRNERLCTLIAGACVKFWKCVESRTPPEDLPTLDAVKRMRRTEGEIKTIPDGLVSDWLAAKDALKQAEEVESRTKALVLAVMGEAEIGETERFGKVTYRAQTRRSLDTKALKLEQPEIAEQYTRDGAPFRVFRHTPPKGGLPTT